LPSATPQRRARQQQQQRRRLKSERRLRGSAVVEPRRRSPNAAPRGRVLRGRWRARSPRAVDDGVSGACAARGGALRRGLLLRSHAAAYAVRSPTR
jgi:hypothetical protein